MASQTKAGPSLGALRIDATGSPSSLPGWEMIGR